MEQIKDWAVSFLAPYEKTWWLRLIRIYFEDHLSTEAASLAYYFLFSIFPLLILFGSVLGLIHFQVSSMQNFLSAMIPAEIISLLSEYLNYVNSNYSSSLMFFSIVFSVYFPWRAVKGLMEDVRRSFKQTDKTRPNFFIARQLICTLLIPLTLMSSFLLIIFGQNVILFINSHLLMKAAHLSAFLLNLWQYLRFLIAAALVGVSLGVLYQLSLDHPLKIREIMPGIFFAIITWVVASILFSFYVENFANYSVIYGTLGAFIVLLLWLFMSGLLFILGSELNAVLLQIRKEKEAEANVLKPSTDPEK